MFGLVRAVKLADLQRKQAQNKMSVKKKDNSDEWNLDLTVFEALDFSGWGTELPTFETGDWSELDSDWENLPISEDWSKLDLELDKPKPDPNLQRKMLLIGC
jgi:predicted YcjX-like family ATPase